MGELAAQSVCLAHDDALRKYVSPIEERRKRVQVVRPNLRRVNDHDMCIPRLHNIRMTSPHGLRPRLSGSAVKAPV